MAGFIRSLPKIGHNGELNKSFITLRTGLLELRENPYEKSSLEYFDYIYWLTARIEKRPMKAIINEKSGKAKAYCAWQLSLPCHTFP